MKEIDVLEEKVWGLIDAAIKKKDSNKMVRYRHMTGMRISRLW